MCNNSTSIQSVWSRRHKPGYDCQIVQLWLQWCPKILFILITTHYHTLPHITTHITIIERVVLARVVGSPSSIRSSSTRHFQIRGCARSAHHIYTAEAACSSGWRYGDHPIPLSQHRPSLQPRPRQRWLEQGDSWALGCSCIGPATTEIEWSTVCGMYYYVFYMIITYHYVGYVYAVIILSLFVITNQ